MSLISDDNTQLLRPEACIASIAQARDRESFIALFTHFAPRLKGYLVRHGADPRHAEELTQETFLTIWRKADQFDPTRATASAWIYTIARNLFFDFVRRERHPDDHRSRELEPIQLTPEEELHATQSEARLRRAIESLPVEQAKVLRLAFFEEQTHGDIAVSLGLPLGTVKSRIRLATAHLRSALDDLT